jgi:hypothetical protein
MSRLEQHAFDALMERHSFMSSEGHVIHEPFSTDIVRPPDDPYWEQELREQARLDAIMEKHSRSFSKGVLAEYLGKPAEPRERPERRPRKPSLASEVRRAKRAGLDIREATIGPDGSLSLRFADGGLPVPHNDSTDHTWDD